MPYFLIIFAILIPRTLLADGLKSYLSIAVGALKWELIESKEEGKSTLSYYSLASQTWKNSEWKHRVVLIKPKDLRHPDICLLFITGSKNANSEAAFLREVAEETGAYTAVIGSVPNQPLFGLKEDALLAYSFKQFVISGDQTWPIIFPMVKSVQRAMDLITEVTADGSSGVSRFVLSGASKRGWTTWLTGANDKRVIAIAPIVFDMLNMKPQIELAARSYGKQSEKIRDYTELGLTDNVDQPRNKQLREWVDPYSYLKQLELSKFIFLGTNDPYWVVDAQQNYYNDLPGVKLIYQVPNGDHHISSDASVIANIITFYSEVAKNQKPPQVEWRLVNVSCEAKAQVELRADRSPSTLRLLKSSSEDRDFRDESWRGKDLIFPQGAKSIVIELKRDDSPYNAYIIEAVMPAADGLHTYKVSSPAYVFPSLECQG